MTEEPPGDGRLLRVSSRSPAINTDAKHNRFTEGMTTMTKITARAALLAAIAFGAAACGGGSGDRDALIEDRVRIGNTQEQAECYADAVIAEFGGDPASDGDLSDEDVTMLLGFVSDCVSGDG